MTDILNRSAPGAAKFVKPFALSYKDASSFEFIISSDISKPTLYDGFIEYGSKIIRDEGTSTKLPRIKYTPAFTPNADPVAVASWDASVKTVSPIVIVVLPYVSGSSRINISPSGKDVLSPSVPDC